MIRLSNFAHIVLAGSIFLIISQIYTYPNNNRLVTRNQYAQAELAYNTVCDHYMDILDAYYRIEEASITEQDYYIKKLIESIIFHVQQDKLVLYGNFLSRTWRHLTTYSREIPLKKFDATFIEDALGHLAKYQKKLLSVGQKNENIDLLISSLKHIRHYVQSSLEYAYESQSFELENLKRELRYLKNELFQEREKRKEFERQLESANNKQLKCIVIT